MKTKTTNRDPRNQSCDVSQHVQDRLRREGLLASPHERWRDLDPLQPAQARRHINGRLVAQVQYEFSQSMKENHR